MPDETLTATMVPASEDGNTPVAEPPLSRWWHEAKARENAVWLRDLFKTDATLADDYLRARVAFPQLGRLDLTNLVIHVEGVIEHFATEGLTRPDYLRVVAAEPWLVNQKPATVIDNLEGVIEHFAGDGLTRRQYLQAALDQTILFVAPSEAIIGNMEAVTAQLADQESMMRSECLCRALDRPRLFSEGVAALAPVNPGPSENALAVRVLVPPTETPTPVVDDIWLQELTPEQQHDRGWAR